MSPYKQRIAIAEACGWTLIQESEYKPFGTAYPVGRSPQGGDNLQNLPDYLNDLNAMAEAERGLGDDQQRTFIRHLISADQAFDRLADFDPVRFTDRESQVADHLCGLGWDEVWCFVLRATAAQRAEAFLRTIGKWEEVK